MADQYVVALIVERDCDEQLDNAVVADLVEEQMRGNGGVKLLAIQVRRRAGHIGAGGYVYDEFIVQNDQQFISENGNVRPFNG